MMAGEVINIMGSGTEMAVSKIWLNVFTLAEDVITTLAMVGLTCYISVCIPSTGQDARMDMLCPLTRHPQLLIPPVLLPP